MLALIPARGGSKGITRKNLRLLAGKPLLRWTAEAALASRHIDRVVLSTEDEEIARAGAAMGIDVPFLRPSQLATDTAHAVDVVRHGIESLPERYDYLVFLEPTSPLRSTADIDACLKALAAGDNEYIVTVSPTPYRPEWMFFVTDDGMLDPVIGRFDARPRQELPDCYVLNGAVYAMSVKAFLRDMTLSNERTLAYVMPVERGVDLNDQTDFDRAEAFIRARGTTPA